MGLTNLLSESDALDSSITSEVTFGVGCTSMKHEQKWVSPQLEPRGFIFPEERINQCEMGSGLEGNPRPSIRTEEKTKNLVAKLYERFLPKVQELSLLDIQEL